MDIILNNVNIIVNNVTFVTPEVLNNVKGFLEKTQYGYYIWTWANAAYQLVQYPVEAGKTYKLKSLYSSHQDIIQACLVLSKMTNEALTQQYTSLSGLSPQGYYIRYGEEGAPEIEQDKKIDNITEITPSSNGYILCYVRNTAEYKKDFYLIEV